MWLTQRVERIREWTEQLLSQPLMRYQRHLRQLVSGVRQTSHQQRAANDMPPSDMCAGRKRWIA